MPRIAIILLFMFTAGAVKGLQQGKIQIERSAVDEFYCKTVNFPSSFTGSGPIKVFTSLSLGSNSSRVHDVGFTWTESVTSSDFKACVVESGTGFEGHVRVNWVAYQVTESGVAEGSARFNDWTTGTQCNRVAMSQRFSSKPKVFVTVRHNVLNKRQDAAAVWVESIARDEFTICLREARTFDGRHKDIEVVWMAFTDIPLSWGNKEIMTLQFPNSVQPKEEDNDAFCQIINFNEPYFSPPSIVLTPSHEYDSSNVNAVPPEHNSIVAWSEEITKTYFRACVKDLVGLNRKHHPITVDYLIFGDLDPCINKTCDYFANCQALAPGVGQCVCISYCPSYQDLVCATNGQTFDNMCSMKREICRISGNFTYYHPGGCQGFPLDKGRHILRQQNYPWSDTHCEVVSLKPYTFYPDKALHIQLTVNYVNALQTSKVHEVTVTWSENVNMNNFTACITRTGRNDNPSNDMASIDWLAYQGAPGGGVAGRERFTRWWTGTTCRTVSLPGGKFSSSPKVLITPYHGLKGLKHDAASAWVEDVSSSSFKICLRELQNFDGVHEDIDVDWMAFEILHYPLFSEYNTVYFPNNYAPPQADNYAFCKTVGMARNYTKKPLVMVTPTHRTGSGRTNPQYNGISAWIESITSRNFRVCMKELYTNQYDPVTIHYAVVSDGCGEGWTYFDGFCYLTNASCTTWQSAQASCLSHNASLTSITSQEENIYVQQRHGGDTGWIGLRDLQNNGNFTWIDGTELNFTFWAPNRPNNNQTCVHTLGPSSAYQWKDVPCSACHPYTCKGEFNECSSNPCHNGGTCIDGKNSFTCLCSTHYTGQQCAITASCLSLRNKGVSSSGVYWLSSQGTSFQAYCDMSSGSGGWTLVARFSNADSRDWMRDDAFWWYDVLSGQGSTTSTSVNRDMISAAFWSVKGSEIKITRSDDSSHTALLQTTSNCLGSRTVRSKLSSYGTFKYRSIWSNDRCLGSCRVSYGGQYRSTSSFSMATCNGNIQSSSYIGFWCQWSTGDGAVMMIGGGGSSCSRADHGIGLTENNYGAFQEWEDSGESDFGDGAGSGSTSYSLNLWIR